MKFSIVSIYLYTVLVLVCWQPYTSDNLDFEKKLNFLNMDMDMEYEYLLRDAFECGRWGDPFGLANADVYRHGIGSDDKHRLVYGISAALKKVSNQNDPNNLDLSHALDALDEQLWADQSGENIDKTIVEARKLLKQLGQ